MEHAHEGGLHELPCQPEERGLMLLGTSALTPAA